MEKEQRIETLENEFKLIKGELKETLTGVRDFLLDTGLPDSEYATIMAAVGGGPQSSMRGELSMAKDAFPEPPPPEPPAPEPEKMPSAEEAGEGQASSGTEPEMVEEVIEEEESDMPVSELPEEMDEQDEPIMPESELAEETDEEDEPEMPQLSEPELLEQLREYQQGIQEVRPSIPPVNLLSNLIFWVSSIKKEIGIEQLPVLLEVYGISGHLSPELKEVILQMADIIEPQSENVNLSSIWSQSILELHGILTGGDAPLHPLKPSWNEKDDEVQLDEAELDEEELQNEKQSGDSGIDVNKPLKLKLVLPVNNGDDSITREFSICLNPEEE